MSQAAGRKSRWSEVTMMTNRSHHIPMFTKMLAMNITGMFVRAHLNQKIWGVSTLQNSIR